ncbi:MAG TPA: response regulator transcription factor [Candidatus Nanopelagicales bacterium]|nr:response regulator transcription factor [Candidatus Nanopelagicales bacterium]
MPRVLVVDDDLTVAEVVLAYLRREGIEATHAGDGLLALDLARQSPPDLVVLDLMLPGIDGLEVCRRLRADHPDLPVVMLTARGEEEDRIAGLEVGADDYVVKPFSPRELALRVQSVLRRSEVRSPSTPAVLVDDDLVVDTGSRLARLRDEPLALTTREFDLLAHLMSMPGRALRRDEILRDVWGWDFGDLSTVTVHVRRLREKVEVDPAAPRRIATVWGVGYRWDGSAGAPA